MSIIVRVRVFSFTMLLMALSLLSNAKADIYEYIEENGVSHFSNVPSDGRYKLYLRTPEAAPAASPAKISANTNKAIVASAKRKHFELYVQEAAKAFQIEAALLHAVITAESNYNARALSRKGAIGLMQLMPQTAKQYGITDPYDPGQNIRGGAQYLKYLLGLFNNDLQLVLAAYNAGENAVRRHGNRLPPYQETLRYVPKVLGYYQKYR